MAKLVVDLSPTSDVISANCCVLEIKPGSPGFLPHIHVLLGGSFDIRLGWATSLNTTHMKEESKARQDSRLCLKKTTLELP